MQKQKKSTTSGAKTHPAVKRVMEAMSAWDHMEFAAPKRSFSQAALPLTTEPASSKAEASSSKAEASRSSSKVNPYELYGVSPPSKRKAMKLQVFAVESSSQEGNGSPVADMEVAPQHDKSDAAVLLQFFDQEKGVMKRQLANGETLEAQCVPGHNGFLLCRFGNEEQCESDTRNLALQIVSKPMPKTLMKKPAALKKPAASLALKEPEVAEPAAPAASVSDEVPLHCIAKTRASEPERTYIQACQCHLPHAKAKEHKKQLIVQYSLAQDGPDHFDKAVKAMKYIEDHCLTWSQPRNIKTLFPQ